MRNCPWCVRSMTLVHAQARDSRIMRELASTYTKYSEGVNFDWLNGWKCWTLASKNVQVEESNRRLENDRAMPLEMPTTNKTDKN